MGMYLFYLLIYQYTGLLMILWVVYKEGWPIIRAWSGVDIWILVQQNIALNVWTLGSVYI